MDGEERIVVKGVGDITDEVKAILSKRRALAVIEASKQLDLAAKVGRERFHVEDASGGGYVQFMIPPAIYHAFGQKWGYACWDDKDFVKDTLKKNEACRVVSRARQTTVSLTNAAAGKIGLAAVSKSGGRFSKTYN